MDGNGIFFSVPPPILFRVGPDNRWSRWHAHHQTIWCGRNQVRYFKPNKTCPYFCIMVPMALIETSIILLSPFSFPKVRNILNFVDVFRCDGITVCDFVLKVLNKSLLSVTNISPSPGRPRYIDSNEHHKLTLPDGIVRGFVPNLLFHNGE